MSISPNHTDFIYLCWCSGERHSLNTVLYAGRYLQCGKTSVLSDSSRYSESWKWMSSSKIMWVPERSFRRTSPPGTAIRLLRPTEKCRISGGLWKAAANVETFLSSMKECFVCSISRSKNCSLNLRAWGTNILLSKKAEQEEIKEPHFSQPCKGLCCTQHCTLTCSYIECKQPMLRLEKLNLSDPEQHIFSLSLSEIHLLLQSVL